jgi:hypothetical protein
MASRLWTALLMLTAVFAMHGVQCTAAADSADARPHHGHPRRRGPSCAG